ncbi:MAG: D-alanyl-D-alanine carboxypeptidase [Cephaloticoccus sp.]|nr:D-alanyl-D-alanine carboxypeptidase [Cephaloticoccus sp.]MCF7762029.1 D-alanyl-D-alanine carboxypeptidase [Cephaloticoccus sp.]
MTFLCRVSFIFILGVVGITVGAGKTEAPVYKGAIIIDAATGLVLFEDNADSVSPPASITKLMTFLVVHDHIASGAITSQTPVGVSAASSKIGGTQVWLKQGESFPVEEMLYALMIQSANDCAHALALEVAGSADAFVGLMNARAKELGMTNTTFRSPHGLPPSNRRIADGDLTSPRDLALLSRYLIQHTNILDYSSIKERVFREGQTNGRIVMRNHNHLIDNVEGVDGLKTGYTSGAGFCLAATARRNGRRIVAVIMGSPSAKVRDLKMAELLQRGFAALPPADSPLTVAPMPANPATNPSGLKPINAAPAEISPVIKFKIPAR